MKLTDFWNWDLKQGDIRCEGHEIKYAANLRIKKNFTFTILIACMDYLQPKLDSELPAQAEKNRTVLSHSDR